MEVEIQLCERHTCSYVISIIGFMVFACPTPEVTSSLARRWPSKLARVVDVPRYLLIHTTLSEETIWYNLVLMPQGVIHSCQDWVVDAAASLRMPKKPDDHASYLGPRTRWKQNLNIYMLILWKYLISSVIGNIKMAVTELKHLYLNL